jgi:enoyl-CoA hydratase
MVLPASWQTLEVSSPEPHVLLVTLNRPAVANALNTQMGLDLRDLWVGLTRDAGDTRAVVLTGSGTKAFCAGGDLKERNGMTVETWQRQHEIFEEAYWTLMELPVPVLAAVNGHAGGTQNLPRAVGERRAKELILTGRPFTAQEAFEWGVVNRIVEPDQLVAVAIETAKTIAANAPMSVRQAKKSIHLGLQADLRTGLRIEVEAYNRLIGTEDRLEGIAAFNEKRKPQFRNR